MEEKGGCEGMGGQVQGGYKIPKLPGMVTEPLTSSQKQEVPVHCRNRLVVEPDWKLGSGNKRGVLEDNIRNVSLLLPFCKPACLAVYLFSVL